MCTSRSLDGAPQRILSDFENLLQYHVATLMDNDIAGQPQALPEEVAVP